MALKNAAVITMLISFCYNTTCITPMNDSDIQTMLKDLLTDYEPKLRPNYLGKPVEVEVSRNQKQCVYLFFLLLITHFYSLLFELLLHAQCEVRQRIGVLYSNYSKVVTLLYRSGECSSSWLNPGRVPIVKCPLHS